MSLKRETVIPVSNETEASFSRNTCDGRRLTYKLKVLQQPERARACGSGAKSSADRRPVDPPPIVELLIFEGEKADKDITFQMNANYFLFATLEQARPIAQGRVPNDPSRMTVLTGTPVAGMVYLDRPEPGGYFIFPDLSVRHEGKYRLGFSLYEELKRPEDHDQIEDANGSMQGEAHITHRLEVKSQPFDVFSAKKFPGLASSTQLSRTVADQGCRVRIRREARMRRREKKDYDGYHSDRSRHTTPDLYQQQAHMAGAHAMVNPVNRERSASIASHVSLAAAPISRRTSGHEMMPSYPQASYPAQVAPQPVSAQPAPIAQPQSQYVPVSPQQYPPQYMQQQQQQQQPPPMQPPQMHYQQQYQYSQAPAPAPAPQHSYYGYPPAAHHPHYEEQLHPRNLSVDYTVSGSSDSRRPSMVQPPVYPHTTQPHPYGAQYPPTHGYAPQQTPKMRQMSQVSQPSTSNPVSHVLPPINTTLAQSNKIEVSPPSSAVSQSHYYDAGPVNGKRSYDRVFDTRHLNGPLRQGARPSISYGPQGGLLADDGADSELAELENLKMSYRRADGREIARPLPPSHD